MPDIKISLMPSAAPLALSDIFPAVVPGSPDTNGQATLSDVQTLFRAQASANIISLAADFKPNHAGATGPLPQITGFSFNVVTGKKYKIRFVLFIAMGGATGVYHQFLGTAVAANWAALYWDFLNTGISPGNSIVQTTANFNSVAGVSTGTTYVCFIKEGTLEVTTGGTVTLGVGAQTDSGNQLIILRGSTFECTQIS